MGYLLWAIRGFTEWIAREPLWIFFFQNVSICIFFKISRKFHNFSLSITLKQLEANNSQPEDLHLYSKKRKDENMNIGFKLFNKDLPRHTSTKPLTRPATCYISWKDLLRLSHLKNKNSTAYQFLELDPFM